MYIWCVSASNNASSYICMWYEEPNPRWVYVLRVGQKTDLYIYNVLIQCDNASTTYTTYGKSLYYI